MCQAYGKLNWKYTPKIQRKSGWRRFLDGILTRMECQISITYMGIKFPPPHPPKWLWKEGKGNLPIESDRSEDLLGGIWGRTFSHTYILHSYIEKLTSPSAQTKLEGGEGPHSNGFWWKGRPFGGDMGSHILTYIYTMFLHSKITSPSTQMPLE